MPHTQTTRRSAVAGRFYPADRKTLHAQVTACLAVKPPNPIVCTGNDVLAVMVPHAGYVFSGAIAGMTLAGVPLPNSIFLLGPSHTGQGVPLSVWADGAWETPLGNVCVDTALAADLLARDAGFCADVAAHTREHSLEVVLPFLQVHTPQARVVPVVVGGVSLERLRTAGEALAETVRSAGVRGEAVGIVVSSDMSHFLPHDVTAQRDAQALKALCSLDPERFYATVRQGNISMCGVLPMTLALYACRMLGATDAEVVAYATSGQTGKAVGADMNRVVGYAGVIIRRTRATDADALQGALSEV